MNAVSINIQARPEILTENLKQVAGKYKTELAALIELPAIDSMIPSTFLYKKTT